MRHFEQQSAVIKTKSGSTYLSFLGQRKVILRSANNMAYRVPSCPTFGTQNTGFVFSAPNIISQSLLSDDFNIVPKNIEITTVTWKIKDYSFLKQKINDYLLSPTFSFSDVKWSLKLYPKGMTHNRSEGSVGLYLEKVTEKAEVRHVSCKMCLISSTNEECHSFKFEHQYAGGKHAYGAVSLIEREELFDEKRKALLPEDVLTIYCELQEGKVQFSVVESANSETKNSRKPSNDICSLESLSSHLGKLYEDKLSCDLTITVNNREFRVHKAILMVRSDVFSAMFSNDMSESRSNTINITDTEPTVVDDMLRFIYTGRIDNLTLKKAIGVFPAADKYALKDLKAKCRKFMEDHLSVETVRDVAILADKYEETTLMQCVKSLIRENASTVFITQQWKDLVEDHPRLTANILQSIITDVVSMCGTDEMSDN